MKKTKKQKHKKLPSLIYLREYYDYDPIAGVLSDKDTGNPLGRLTNGYLRLYVKGKEYLLHRLCFYMYHGRDPGDKVVDHINGDKLDNAGVNLRAVTCRENRNNTAANRKKNGRPKGERGAAKCFFELV